MNMRPAIIAAMLGGSVLVAAPARIDHRPRFIWNASASVPIGLYRVESAREIGVADLAVVMPPEPLAGFLAERGYLPKSVPLLKRVLALAGATICRQGTAIIANGVSFGYARERDGRGRQLPVWQGCRVITDGQAFFMNRDAAGSFDGRYFGPLPLTSIVGRAIPVLTTDRTSSASNPSG
ncbi:MAG: S26 family signal peptidase [Mesorhizobium sp.]|nr:MAG: S26 family signal peptidase [Mesorhizobium sp.]